MNNVQTSRPARSAAELFELAEKITAFGQAYCGRYYSTAAKFHKFEPGVKLAGIGAFVSDDEGSLQNVAEAAQAVGAIRLRLDIERFRHDRTPHEADEAESDVLSYARSLGLFVKSDGDGSGEYGRIECYELA